MKYVPTLNEQKSMVPAACGAVMLFLLLGIITPPAANWLMAGIIACVAYPIIYLFCLTSFIIIHKIGIRHKVLYKSSCLLLGAIFSSIGYFLANQMLYFTNLYWVFLCSGLTSAAVMAMTVNKQIKKEGTSASYY